MSTRNENRQCIRLIVALTIIVLAGIGIAATVASLLVQTVNATDAMTDKTVEEEAARY